jgi:hypothetical protein
MTSRATSISARIPMRSITAAAKGPHRPKRRRLIETASATTARDQPKSCSSGKISTLGTARPPEAASSVRKVTPTMSQP